MKRFKKLTIYLLVGILASSSVMMNYKKAETVKAVAVVDDALILISILGAMGVVYVGTQWYGSNLAEDWVGDYKDEVMDLEDNIINLYDNAVWNAYNNSHIPNPDDFDPENDDPNEKPPTYEKLKQWLKSHPGETISLTTALGLGNILMNVANDMKGELTTNEITLEQLKEKYGWRDFVLESGISYLGCTSGSFVDAVNMQVKNGKIICTGFVNGGATAFYTYTYDRYGDPTPENVDALTINIQHKTAYLTNTKDNILYMSPRLGLYEIVSSTEQTSSSSWTSFILDSKTQIYYNPRLKIILQDEGIDYPYETDNAKIETNYVKYNNPSINQDYEFGGINLPTNGYLTVGNEQLSTLLDSLYNAQQLTDTEKETVEQNATNTFIESIGGIESNPNDNPQGGTTPDTGGDTDDEENNEDFTVQLSHLFPFCIPFDLIDCFRLFNAEPVTPRVEIPMHFDFVGVDYTFVIDLEDFNGVAQVCRTMFLIMFMVGLVMSTRSLIRG